MEAREFSRDGSFRNEKRGDNYIHDLQEPHQFVPRSERQRTHLRCSLGMLQTERHTSGQLSPPSRKRSEHGLKPFPSKFTQVKLPCPFSFRFFRRVGRVNRVVTFVIELRVHLITVSHERAIVPVFPVLVGADISQTCLHSGERAIHTLWSVRNEYFELPFSLSFSAAS